MRIGILGLGRIGAFHAETLSGLGAVESLVVSDPFADAAKAAAERFGAEVADSPEALLAAGVDGVVVASAQATISAGWASVAAATTTPSTPDLSSASGESAGSAPRRPATWAMTDGTASVTTRESTAGSSDSVPAWKAPILPSPMSPSRMS